MQLFKRIIYLVYYFKELDWPKLWKFMEFVSANREIAPVVQWVKIIYSSLRYNISILEYFQFKFYEIPDEEKKKFAGTGTMYEYQRVMNPMHERKILEDKIKFLKTYAPFVKHRYASLQQVEQNQQVVSEILNNGSTKVVIKNSFGQCGEGVEVLSSKDLSSSELIRRMRKTKNDLVEEFVVQHESLMKLSPSGLNTVRIITQLNAYDEVEIIGARLRITINSIVDNLAAGNLAAPIDQHTGKIIGPGVYSDITFEDESRHPVTGIEIVGFQIPFWKETVEMVMKAALANKGNRSIGWDVAITNTGAELIEGNHDWCKLLWQLPVKKGLKPVLQNYLKI